MDQVRKLILINYSICLIGIIAEVFFAFQLAPKEQSVFVFLILWGSLPAFALMLFLLKTPHTIYSMVRSLFQISAVVGIGIFLKINSIYIHPDPRGAIALATIPIIQIIGALFIGLAIKITSRKHYRRISDE